tara:strand:- start:3961 stop:4539 length:579 start_codon:yes stop_codon:yes gene_type:complete
MLNKKAAMFGLDARIALAIFGALSVISGAALYSAIEQSKYVAASTILSESAKAVEQYMLDTGSDFPFVSGVGYEVKQLVESTAPGWKGPYVTYKTHATRTDVLYIPNFLGADGIMHLYNCKAGETDCQPCDNTTNCEVWLKFMNYSEETYNKLDEYIDNSDGLTAGKIRVKESVAGNVNSRLYYKVMDSRLY